MGEPRITPWLKWSLIAGLGLAAVTFLWVVSRALRAPSQPSEPLWTEAALPPVPPKADNGFSLLVDQHNSLGKHSVTTGLDGIASPSSGASADARWTEMLGPAVTEFLDAPDTATRIPGFEDALTRPRFSDDCGVGLDVDCPLLVVVSMHKTMELRAARLAARGDWAAAWVWAGRLARADAEFVTSARGIVAHMVGITVMQRSMELAAVLAHRLDSEGLCSKKSAELATALEAQRDVLASVDPARMDMRKAVISEYLAERRQLQQLIAGSVSLRERLLLDPDDTLRRHDRRYRLIAAYAASPLTTPAPPSDPVDLPWTEYASNPIGKQTLAMLQMDFAKHVEDFERKRLEMGKRRDEVVKGLGVCLAR